MAARKTRLPLANMTKAERDALTIHAEPFDMSLCRLDIGDEVEVLRDDGTIERRVVRGVPRKLSDTWMVWLEGIPGGYALCRCRRAEACAADAKPSGAT